MTTLILMAALSSNLPTSYLQVLDGNGDPYSGAKLYTYEGGTTTPLATYSDRALSSSNANPVVADANGRFGEIYLTGNTAYKLILKTSADVTVWTDDDVYGLENTASGLTAKIEQVVSDPLAHGAAGNGSTNDHTALQAAIDGATGTVDLLGKTYRCDSTLTLASGITLKNGTLDFSNSASNEYVKILGTIGSANALTSNATRGNSEIQVTTVSGLSAGDWLYLYSGAPWYGASDDLAEILKISSIAGLQVDFSVPMESGYLTADSASVKEISPMSNVTIDGVSIVGSTSASGTGIGIYVEYGERVRIVNTRINGMKGHGVLIYNSWDVVVDGCQFEEFGASAEGVTIARASQYVDVINSKFYKMEKGVWIGPSGEDGQTRWATVGNNGMNGVEIGVKAGCLGQYATITNNDITGNGTDDGVYVCSVDSVVSGNKIRGAGDRGIDIDIKSIVYTGSGPHSVSAVDNMIIDPTGDGIKILGDNTENGSVEITGNTITSAGGRGVYVVETDYAHVSGNHIDDAGLTGIFLNIVEGGDVSLNTIVNPGDCGIELEEVSRSTVSGNSISEVDDVNDHGIYQYSDADSISITDNRVLRADDAADGILLDAGSGVMDNATISGNTVSNGLHGVKVSDCGNGVVSGNVFDSVTDGIYIDDPKSIWTVTGNSVSSASEGVKVTNINSAVTSFVVSNNSIVASDNHGIAISNGSTADISYVSVSGNSAHITGGAGDNPLFISGKVKYLTVSGNTFIRDNDSDDNIHLQGGGAARINEVNIVGNTCYNGDYGIGEPTDADNTNVQAIGNIFASMATGSFEGTIDNDLAADDHNAN